MSGGSYNYAFRTAQEMAHQIDPQLVPRRLSPERAWFARHLLLVAEAMRLIEWVDSSDNAPGDENPAIRAVIEHAQESLL